jgi:hypothetical protein
MLTHMLPGSFYGAVLSGYFVPYHPGSYRYATKLWTRMLPMELSNLKFTKKAFQTSGSSIETQIRKQRISKVFDVDDGHTNSLNLCSVVLRTAFRFLFESRDAQPNCKHLPFLSHLQANKSFDDRFLNQNYFGVH